MENTGRFEKFWSLLTDKISIDQYKEAVRSIVAESYPEIDGIDAIVSDIKQETHWINKSRIMGEAFERLFITQSCPKCHKHGGLKKYTANKKSKDVVCQHCHKQYQIKSCQKSAAGHTLSLIGAEYTTTLASIREGEIDYVIYLYSDMGTNFRINKIYLVKNQDISDACIIPRKPLSATAKRAGWQGCTLKFDKFTSIC